MSTPMFSVVRTTQTAIDANLMVAALRAEGFHPLELETAGHFSTAGVDVSFQVQVPTDELSAAREFLAAF